MTSITAEALEQFWSAEWYNITTKPKNGLCNWILENKFEINSPPTSSDNFTLHFNKSFSPILGLAFDCNRFSTAAIETYNIFNLAPHKALTKSTGWLAIQSYYAAFYAAHALLRIFGHSNTLLNPPEITLINKMMGLYFSPTTNVVGGYYSITLNEDLKQVQFKRAINTRPHHQLWKDFCSLFDQFIFSLSTTGSIRHQRPMLQLQSLVNNLRYKNKDGTWLSQVREDINYRHDHDAWFSYNTIKDAYIANINRIIGDIKLNSLDIDLDGSPKNEVLRFFLTTNYIVSLCCEIITHMDSIHPSRKTLHDYGPLILMRLLR